MTAGSRERDEHGSGTALVAAVILVLMVVAAGLLVVAGYVAVAHHARSAADLVALSGAATRGRGGDACGAAAVVASRNGVRLAGCSERGDSFDYVVTVRVEQPVSVRLPGLPESVVATAHAGKLGLL